MPEHGPSTSDVLTEVLLDGRYDKQ
jgi:hypothetical protein